MIYYWTLGEKINQKKNNLLRLGLDHNYNFVKKNIFNTPSYNSICGNSGNSRKKEGITDDTIRSIIKKYGVFCCHGLSGIGDFWKQMIFRRKMPIIILDTDPFGCDQLKRVYFFSANYSRMLTLPESSFCNVEGGVEMEDGQDVSEMEKEGQDFGEIDGSCEGNTRLDFLISQFNLPYSRQWINNTSPEAPILICPNHSQGWVNIERSSNNNDKTEYRLLGSLEVLRYTVKEIRRHTNRPIKIRLHPKDRQYLGDHAKRKMFKKMIHRCQDVTLESSDTMDELTKTVFGVVVDRSSIGIEFILRGIPVYYFFTDSYNSSPFKYPFVNESYTISLGLQDLTEDCSTSTTSDENRKLPSLTLRRKFLEHVSRHTWSNREIREGAMLEKLHSFVMRK